MSEPLIRLEALTKRYGAVTAVDGVSLDIASGEFFALLGPSGCGKTSLMRLIAGFETPDAGRILLEGRDIAAVPPYLRPVNMMFQSYALFPHMSVERNVAYGLAQAGLPRREIATRVTDMLDLVQLDGKAARRPHQLSGGEKQRVALARALARRPKLLLLDEPLAALDRKLREETQFELMRIQRELGTTFLIVTHDQDEAMAMAQRIAVMRAGALAQIGSPREVYDQPADRFVAGFIGKINLFDAKVVSIAAGVAHLSLDAGAAIDVADQGLSAGDRVAVAVRPEDIEFSLDPANPGAMAGELTDAAFLGDRTLLRARLDSGVVVHGARINSRSADASRLTRGARVAISFSPSAARVLLT